MQKVCIFSYSAASASAKELRKALSIQGISTVIYNNANWTNSSSESKEILKTSYKLFNWGAYIQENLDCPVTNRLAARYSDKLNFFLAMPQGIVPPYTKLKYEAEAWLETGNVVVARSSTKLCGGNGITLLKQGDTIPDAPLYTMYKKKQAEYRCHFFSTEDGVKTFWQMKKFNKELLCKKPEEKFQIRNHSNGWLFSSINFTTPTVVEEVANIAIGNLPLTYGALDIIYNDFEKKAYVLEVNTAPGLSEKALNFYVEGIKEMIA